MKRIIPLLICAFLPGPAQSSDVNLPWAYWNNTYMYDFQKDLAGVNPALKAVTGWCSMEGSDELCMNLIEDSEIWRKLNEAYEYKPSIVTYNPVLDDALKKLFEKFDYKPSVVTFNPNVLYPQSDEVVVTYVAPSQNRDTGERALLMRVEKYLGALETRQAQTDKTRQKIARMVSGMNANTICDVIAESQFTANATCDVQGNYTSGGASVEVRSGEKNSYSGFDIELSGKWTDFESLRVQSRDDVLIKSNPYVLMRANLTLAMGFDGSFISVWHTYLAVQNSKAIPQESYSKNKFVASAAKLDVGSFYKLDADVQQRIQDKIKSMTEQGSFNDASQE